MCLRGKKKSIKSFFELSTVLITPKGQTGNLQFTYKNLSACGLFSYLCLPCFSALSLCQDIPSGWNACEAVSLLIPSPPTDLRRSNVFSWKLSCSQPAALFSWSSLMVRIVPAISDLWNSWGQGLTLCLAPGIVFGTWWILTKYAWTEWGNYSYIQSHDTTIMMSEQLIIVIADICSLLQILFSALYLHSLI